MTTEELEKRFTYHPPKGDQFTRYEVIRTDALLFAAVLCNRCPDSRELSLALTKLEEAVFWANAAIARSELTSCNYCTLRWIRQRAKEAGRKVVLKTEHGGTAVYVDGVFKAWFSVRRRNVR